MMAGDVKPTPVPQGKYLPATRHGDLVYTSGTTPRELGILTCEGRVRTHDPIAEYKDSVILACANALAAARSTISEDEKIGQVLSLTVFVVSDPDFQAHSRLADFASEYLFNELGEAGVGARTALGVASLPGNAPVEIQLIAAVSRRGAEARASDP